MVVRLTWAEAPDWVVARLMATMPGPDETRRSGGTRWVGIDGFGAAGKSTLAAALADRLPGAQLVAVDDFARASVVGWDRDAFAAQVLEPLLQGRRGRYQRWDLLHERGLDWVDVHPGRPVIVEGVSATDVRVPVPWDLTIWVDLPAAERRRRILHRDPPELLRRWEEEWWPPEEEYARRQRPWQRVSAIVQA